MRGSYSTHGQWLCQNGWTQRCITNSSLCVTTEGTPPASPGNSTDFRSAFGCSAATAKSQRARSGRRSSTLPTASSTISSRSGTSIGSASADVDSYAERARAFGCHAIVIDGHAVETISRAYAEAVEVKDKPVVIVASTIKGKGAKQLESRRRPGARNVPASSSHRRVFVVDNSKLSAQLGARKPVPVEVVQFGWQLHAEYLRGAGADVTLRMRPAGGPFVTDQR